jgi:hypothetical protein
VPETTYELCSFPCGATTCQEMRPVTRSHSETRTRTVTRYRTAYRNVDQQVTRYRTEHRTFRYAALVEAGHYDALLRVSARPEPPVIVTINEAMTKSGVTHDVTFAPAGVHPETADLPTREDFFDEQSTQLKSAFVIAMNARYGALYCSASAYTPEEAARCAYLDPEGAPAAVHAALRNGFGDDEELLAPLLKR